MSALGPVTKRIFLGGGLNSHADPVAIEEGQLQTATRVRIHKGVLYKDKGVLQYGADTDATAAAQGIGYHQHPTDPRLLVAADGDIKLDSDGIGTAWTDIKTGLDATADVCFANYGGITYIANGVDREQRFEGGTSCVEVFDFPRPDDTPLNYQPTPDDILIESFDDALTGSPVWTGTGFTLTEETSIHMFGLESLKCVSAGVAGGERLDIDLGASATVDISESDYVSFWVNASRHGNYFVFKMSEDNTNWFTKWVDVPDDKLATWIQVIWDIRDIDPASRNGIRYLRFGIPENLGASVTIYLDHLAHCGPLAGEYMYAISFLRTNTGDESPIGCFRRAATREPDELTQAMPGRAIVIPSNAVYMPPNATQIRLYRTMSGASGSYYKIADITPAANAWTYTDTTPDNELDETEALTIWPGPCPRAQWLIPHADRMLHVGGKVVASRNDCLYSSSDPTGRNTGTLVASQYPPLPIYGMWFVIQTGATGTLTWNLQRSAKGAGSWTTVATASANQVWDTLSYVLPFTPSSYGDILFDTEHWDWRIACGTAPAGLKVQNGWDAGLSAPIMYRLICHASNMIAMSNFGHPDRVPPIQVEEEMRSELSGGYIYVAPTDGQDLTGWLKHGSDLLFYKERCTYLFTGTSMDDAEISLAHPSLGCKAWRTAKDCDGAAVWMAADKQIYMWENEEAPVMLSKPIEEFLDGLTEAQVAGANAVWSERRYYLFLPNAPVGSRCRFYDFDEKAWSAGYDGQVYDGMPYGDDPSLAVPYLLRDGGTYMEVCRLNNAESEEAADVTWLARSKAYEFREEFTEDPLCVKRLAGYRLWVKGTATDTLTVKWYVDRGTSATRTYTDTIPAGSIMRSIERYVDNDIMGSNIAVEVGGAHDTETALGMVEVWLDEVR